MLIIDFLVDVVSFLWKNRNNPITMAVLLPFIAYLVDKFGRKLITNQIKRLFHVRDKSEFAQYKANQLIIMENQRLMMEHLGVKGWDAHLASTSESLKNTSLRKMNLLPLLAGLYRAATTGAFTTRTERSNHFKTREESIQMTKDILSGKKKFLAMIIAVLVNGLNDVFDLNLSVNTLEASTYIAGGLIAVEGALDIIRALSNHFMQKNTVVTVTETPGAATTTLTPLTDVEKSYHGE